VFRLLAKHNKQLRSLMVVFASDSTQAMHWGAPVAGLPDAAGPVEWEWRPDAALAGLRGLEELDAATQLFVRDGGDWQHLVQLAAMTKLVWVEVHYAPPLLLPSPQQQQQQQQLWRWLSLMELEYCWSSLDGHGLGRLLLACPALQRACIAISKPSTPGALPALPAAGEPLPPHSSLKEMQLHSCCHWGSAAAAAAHWAALAPVLSGVPAITIHEWPLSSSSSSSSSPAGGRMPDLAPCTAVSTLKLCFECSGQPAGVQEDFLAMLAPLVQLKQLGVQRAAWLNARNVVTLQYMLPQLQLVQLVGCGSLLPAAAGGPAQQQEQQQEGQQQHAGEEQEPVQPEKQAQQQQEQDANEEAEQQVLGKVMQLLRPGLCLEVSTYPQSVKDGEQQAAAPDGTSSGTTSISTSYTSSGSGSSSSSSSSSDAEGGSSK
jgi:hypothetical protein